MMKLALMLVLLPLAQEDPQVTYREGLFEEVDQGNLEKAAELYAKVLKSGASDGLKAKALLRTGFCHEKKGRKKEAEQAWRDVVERYPAAAETVKVARERLSRPEDGPASKSTEEQIQREIFSLGSGDDNTRIEARRMLLFIGEPAVVALQKALQNRDRSVSGGAARVLYEMELRDGLYEALRRFWISKGELSGDDFDLLPRLLETREADREKFLKDYPVLRKSPFMHDLAQAFCALPDPRFARIVEDLIVETEDDPTNVAGAWVQNRPAAEVVKLMKRLNSRKPPLTDRVLLVFDQYLSAAKEVDRDAKAECLAALTAAPEGTDYFASLKSLTPYFSVSELVRGPVAAWLARRPVEDKRKLLENIANLEDNEEGSRRLLAESRKFLFEQLAATDVPLETKELILASGFNPGTAEEQAKFLSYCLHFWKEQGAKGERKSDALRGVLAHLAYYLPPDSKELPEILDAAFDLRATYPGAWGERPVERRPLVIAAAHRSLLRNTATRDGVLDNFGQYCSPQEHLSLAKLLPELGRTPVANRAARMYARSGFRALDSVGQEAHWKELAGCYEAGTPAVKTGLVQELVGLNYPPVDQLMKSELKSPIEANRAAAIQHWGQRKSPEALQNLIAALEDDNLNHRHIAMGFLRATPSLESVPALIKQLNSALKEIRVLAQTTLVEFKLHFEAQALWQQWYDETKRALGK